MLNVWRINCGCIDGANALDGGVEVVKGLLLNDHRDHGGYASEGLGLIDQDDAVGFLDGFEDRLDVERADGAEVEHLGVDAVLCFGESPRRRASG
jgi:hypothetical protein